MNDAELRALYQARTGRRAQRGAACPTADDLVDIVAGAAGRAARERLADHLVTCADCTQEYRLLQSVHEQLREIDAAPHAASAPSSRGASLSFGARLGRGLRLLLVPAGRPLAIATGILVVVAAVGAAVFSIDELAGRDRTIANLHRQLGDASARTAQLEEQVAGLRERVDAPAVPHLNVPVVDLSPGDAFRGAPDRRETIIAIPAAAGLVTLILNVVGDVSHADYAVEIVDGSGQVIWSGRGLEKSPVNTFTLALPRRLLGSSSYRIKLYGLRGTERVLVEDYAVRFQIH